MRNCPRNRANVNDPLLISAHSFVMKNMFFHDLYIDSTGSEGFYIGNTGYNEGKGVWKLNCCNFENSTDMGGQNGGTGASVIPHWLNNVKIAIG